MTLIKQANCLILKIHRKSHVYIWNIYLENQHFAIHWPYSLNSDWIIYIEINHYGNSHQIWHNVSIKTIFQRAQARLGIHFSHIWISVHGRFYPIKMKKIKSREIANKLIVSHIGFDWWILYQGPMVSVFTIT